MFGSGDLEKLQFSCPVNVHCRPALVPSHMLSNFNRMTSTCMRMQVSVSRVCSLNADPRTEPFFNSSTDVIKPSITSNDDCVGIAAQMLQYLRPIQCCAQTFGYRYTKQITYNLWTRTARTDLSQNPDFNLGRSEINFELDLQAGWLLDPVVTSHLACLLTLSDCAIC